MLQRELTREQAIQTGEHILDLMEGHILERGYTYFSNGVVFNTRVEDGKLLKSDVQGTQIYHVSLHLDAVQDSTCTCPYSRLCKHIAATFFQMYSVFDNPRHFLTRAQQPRLATYSPAMLAPAFKRGIRNLTQSETSENSHSPLQPESSVNQWWTFFESWTRNLFAAMESFRASSELLSSYENVLGIASKWPENRGQLFAVHATLFHLLKLQEFVQIKRQSYWFHDLSQTAERLLLQLEGILYYLDAVQLHATDLSDLEETKELVQTWKYMEPNSLYWSYAYQLLWWELLQRPEWTKEEADELNKLIHLPETTEADKEKYGMLLGHFLVMKKEDQAALDIWLPNKRLGLTFYLPYVKSFARKNDWSRFIAWIDRLERLVGEAEPQHYRLVTTVWREAMEQIGRGQECGKKLKKFLPGSFQEYASYLFENQQYKDWMDLQLSYRVSFTDIPAWQIKQVEEAAPVLLFPFYLQEINRLIGERSRTSYKEAIKLLKKVRSLYSKVNQEARWGSYLDQLSAKYNRLRAFQEELRRGNLNL